MESNPELPPAQPLPTAQTRLAVASLVLSIIGCVLSLFLVGALFGLSGLLLGAVCIMQKRGSKMLASWGIALGMLSILISLALGTTYYSAFKNYQSQGDSSFLGWQGVVAPDLSVTTLDGKTIRLSELKGKRVVLDFWATWCGPCVMEIPHFNKLYNETSRDDLVILGISNEDEAAIKAFAAQKGVRYPVASLQDFPPPYQDIRYIPTTFFIDRKGVIQKVSVGYHDFNTLKAGALTADYPGPPKEPPIAPLKTSEPGGTTSK